MRTTCITACLLLAASAALALDDGGGRSVFATGAGNRALGLGGAYCAIADDASAAIWNPGGLGWLQRKELQATQTTLFGLGFQEQFAGLVVPHYRWGTASFTFRRFGVDGIEQRDDRGALLDDDLQDSEVEVGLGYGRAVSQAVSIGGVVKMQRQSLAGYSGSGLGLDAGVLVRPVAGLTIGAAVRNLIEPQIRLDVDEVPDPTGLRAGLAWRHAVGGGLVLLASADAEKTRHMDTRMHAGLQAQLDDVLALRAGSAAGDLTAGASVRWHGVGVDYQFEDNPLGQIHRFGVALAFGPTVEESRRHEQAAAAAALQAQLDAAFAARMQDQARKLVQDARDGLVTSRWDDALAALESLRVLDPDHPDIARLSAEAWRGQARAAELGNDLTGAAIAFSRAAAACPADTAAATGLARVQRQSSERAARTREVRARFDAGLDAFSRGDLLAARQTFADLVAENPADREAAAMRQRTEEAIGLRVTTALDQAAWLLDVGRCDDAEAQLAEARRFDAAAPAKEIERKIARCRADATAAAAAAAAKSAARTAPAAATPAPALSDARRDELADLYRRGVKALGEGRNDEAARYWEMVWAADPTFAGVRDHLLQEYLTAGMDAFANGDLRASVAKWENAVRVAPDDPRARGYLDRAHTQMRQMERIGAGR